MTSTALEPRVFRIIVVEADRTLARSAISPGGLLRKGPGPSLKKLAKSAVSLLDTLRASRGATEPAVFGRGGRVLDRLEILVGDVGAGRGDS